MWLLFQGAQRKGKKTWCLMYENLTHRFGNRSIRHCFKVGSTCDLWGQLEMMEDSWEEEMLVSGRRLRLSSDDVANPRHHLPLSSCAPSVQLYLDLSSASLSCRQIRELRSAKGKKTNICHPLNPTHLSTSHLSSFSIFPDLRYVILISYWGKRQKDSSLWRCKEERRKINSLSKDDILIVWVWLS